MYFPQDYFQMKQPFFFPLSLSPPRGLLWCSIREWVQGHLTVCYSRVPSSYRRPPGRAPGTTSTTGHTGPGAGLYLPH